MSYRKRNCLFVIAILLASAFVANAARVPATEMAVAAAGDPTTEMHIDQVGVSWNYAGGAKKQGNARVIIRDGLGNIVEGVTVTGDWSDCKRLRNTSGTTDATGEAYILGPTTVCRNTDQCYFVFNVTNISKAGMTWNSAADVETSGQQACNPFAN